MSGKSALLKRYINNVFHENFTQTVGLELKRKRISFAKLNIVLDLFDMAGPEMLKSIRQTIEQNAHCILLIYDICSMSSF
jgi:Ras-related protein Rab-15